MAKKIFFGNYKGGVGKTTTVFEIAAVLAERHNKKVLLIDLDPQCSLSKICGNISSIKLPDLKVEDTLNFAIELYGEYVAGVTRLDILEGRIETNFSIIRNAIKNIPKYSKKGGQLDFIPTVLDMKNSRLNDISERLSKNSINILTISKILSDIEENEQYDYILFDCPPTSNTIIQSVFISCDYYFIPTIGDEISSDGVADYITEIESTYLKFAYDNTIGGLILKKYFGEKPKLIGVLSTMFKGRSNATENSQVLEALDRAITAIGIQSMITDSDYVATGKSHIFKVSIPNLDNRSNPSDYGIPITISNGDIHKKYFEIGEIIANII